MARKQFDSPFDDAPGEGGSESSHPDGRRSSGDGTETKHDGGRYKTDALSVATRLSPRDALKFIFTNLADAGSGNLIAAYKKLRADLLRHAYILIPDSIALGDFLSKMMQLDEFTMSMKTKGGDSGKLPAQVLADFLSSPTPTTVKDDDGNGSKRPN